MDEARLDKALACLAHRGPDGEGRLLLRDGRLAMGHRRLAIFGPGDAGRQPMVAPWGDCLVFNGSLYNYPELREQLAALGHVFRTDTDTEVILAAWRQWGEECFARFNGTWALALYEAESERLILSRDRLGVRPLYVTHQNGRLVAASEVKAVIAAAGMTVTVDRRLAFQFLALGLVDHEERTLVEGVTQVPAGAVWELDRDGRLWRRRYHSWPAMGSYDDVGAAVARLPDLLADATRLRLRSHVPIAAQLSGGLDSGAVAWAVGRHRGDISAPFKGFYAYGYTDGGGEFDETDAARQTRDHVAAGLPLTEVRVDPTPSPEDVEDFLWAQELPVNTPSPLAGLRLCRAMRAAGATVVLTGEGSDELFAGYTRRYLPLAWRDAVLGADYRHAAALWRSPELRWRDAFARLVWNLPLPALRGMMGRRPFMTVLADDFRHSQQDGLRDLIARQTLSLDETGAGDARGGLLSQILRIGDRNAMAAGMEARSPFLDYRIADLAMGLPMAAKIDAQGGKRPLRRAMAPYLPPSVTGGAKNRGLGHAEQFRVGRLDLGALLRDPPQGGRDLVEASRLAEALRRNPSDPNLWRPVCLLLWLRQVEQRWP